MKKVVLVFYLFLILGLCLIYYKSDFWRGKKVLSQSLNVFKDEEIIKKQEYMNCLNEPYASSTLDDEFTAAFEELKSSGVAIYFKDINNDYVWNMNSTKIYYSASTSKLFEVIYLVEEARKGNIDLNSTLVYKPSDARASSKGMKNHSFYDEISILKLIEYVLTYSDNTAHVMLINYIGVDTLKEYFSDLNLAISESDPYVRNYNAIIAKKSLERVYDLWQTEDDYTDLMKTSMANSNLNYLSFDDKIIYHKYGLYSVNYHDIGIYDGDNPYIIVVLTQYGNLERDIYGAKVQDISKKVYEIYSNNLKLKEEYCQSKISK